MDRSADWMAPAKRDLERASVDVRYEFWEWACFTSQQAAEKAVKALLMHHGRDAWGWPRVYPATTWVIRRRRRP